VCARASISFSRQREAADISPNFDAARRIRTVFDAIIAPDEGRCVSAARADVYEQNYRTISDGNAQ
jgi:hypothetical protein